jgi:hypothetical protein
MSTPKLKKFRVQQRGCGTVNAEAPLLTKEES